MTTPMDIRTMKRCTGTLFGQAIGDALGTTMEFRRLGISSWDPLSNPMSTIVGGGPFSVEAGQVTDDTQMAAALATSLLNNDGYNSVDALRRYCEWRKHAFDIGTQTSAALAEAVAGRSDIEEEDEFLYGGEKVWELRHGSGNGSLMRASPIGVFFHDNRQYAIETSIMDAMLTHFDPRCALAGAVFNASISRLITGETDLGSLIRDAKTDLRVAEQAAYVIYEDTLNGAPKQQIQEAAEDLLRDLEAADHDNPYLVNVTHHHERDARMDMYTAQGFVRVAFRLAYWELLHRNSFEEIVLDVANRGGDADTNGAIAGALAGAYYGADNIRSDWKLMVDGACRGSKVWGPEGQYHPAAMFRMFDAME